MTENPFQKIRRFRVLENRSESPRIFTLTLVPESPEDIFDYDPGQWVFLHLHNEDGSTWKAPFSIATAPQDAMEGLEFTIKIYKDFTMRASQLPVGETVGIQGPFGVFTPGEEESSFVFFASGIGITPFVSMIRSFKFREQRPRVTLFYSVRELENFLLRQEFEQLAQEWPEFKLVFIMTGEAPEGWSGERGRLDAGMFDRHAPDLGDAVCLACGKPEFVTAVRGMLEAKGFDVKTRFRTEMFG